MASPKHSQPPHLNVTQWRPDAGYSVAAVTRTGSAREANEDSYVVVPPDGARPWLVAVADGVGGETAGEIASATAVRALETSWRASWAGQNLPDVVTALKIAATAADHAVRIVSTSPETYGAATTLTAVVISSRQLVAVHAGDSSVWVRHSDDPQGDPIRRVTPTHTVLAEAIAARQATGLAPLTPEAMRRIPGQGAITRYLGMSGGCPIDTVVLDNTPTSPATIVVCSDGVTDVLNEADLDLACLAGPADRAASEIVRVVTGRRGNDDATAVIVTAIRAYTNVRPDDPFGLRQVTRADHTIRRRVLIGTVGATVAVAVGAGGALSWPSVSHVIEDLRGSRGSDPADAGRDYLAQMATRDYATLWLRTTAATRRQVPQPEFAQRHRDFMAEIDATKMMGAIVTSPPSTGATRADLTADLAYTSGRFGAIAARVILPFVWEDAAWRLTWGPAVLLPNLVAGRRVRVQSDPPVRGSILDRTGKPLAMPRLPGSTDPSPSASPTSTPTATSDRSQAPATPHASLRERGTDRIYPAGSLAGPIVGYTAEATTEELATLQNLGYVAGDRIGRAGLERIAETQIAGARGSRLDVINPDGGLVLTIASTPPRHGGTVTTTVDLALQRVAEAALGERVGSVVALDPSTGAILALATWPRYDPTQFASGNGVEALLSDPRLPLLNRPIQGLYPAGSTFKVVTMAAALDNALAKPDTEFTCTGVWTGLPGVSQRCWLGTGHGTITLSDGLTQSCNSVFYELGKRLGAADATLLPSTARAAGLGVQTGAFAGEEPTGLVPDPTWKRTALKEPWTPGDNVNLAIGQGQLLVTPLQLARVYAMIATGSMITPSILASMRLPGGNVEQILVPPALATTTLRPWGASTLATMRMALQAVPSTREGTAVGAFAGSKITKLVAGKTGTAETQPGRPTHAWFAGYGPIASPTLVVVAMVEMGGEGSRVAAPIARTVLEAGLQ